MKFMDFIRTANAISEVKTENGQKWLITLLPGLHNLVSFPDIFYPVLDLHNYHCALKVVTSHAS